MRGPGSFANQAWSDSTSMPCDKEVWLPCSAAGGPPEIPDERKPLGSTAESSDKYAMRLRPPCFFLLVPAQSLPGADWLPLPPVPDSWFLPPPAPTAAESPGVEIVSPVPLPTFTPAGCAVAIPKAEQKIGLGKWCLPSPVWRSHNIRS